MGYALLKIPFTDAQTLLNTLFGTSFRDRVSLRWQPESWRMNVPLVYEEHNRIGLSPVVEIQFPRKQIPELAHVLGGCLWKEIDMVIIH